MEPALKQHFMDQWNQYFPDAELPIAFYYTDEEGHAEKPSAENTPHCLIGALARVRAGRPLAFEMDTIGCGGGKRYTGFVQALRPGFEYFLSYGIPGKMEGERYKKSPELVQELMKDQPEFVAPGKYLVFKRWDMLEEADEISVVVFFATPDVLSGLFTLANFDESDPQGVIAPMGSGCSAIIQTPFKELDSEHPHAILGMFDVSARPYVPAGTLSFAIPWPKFERMVENMDESFLITESWNRVQRRL